MGRVKQAGENTALREGVVQCGGAWCACPLKQGTAAVQD